ncbi:Vps54-domain-containing protein [Coprinellus micaceus]|uniref:Vps54-domain-containing protein n=1 Tax=Coprinellus micaceus TaxID=71717 RepID=A0A4Y7SXL1_COPMI|nr:Vps54-domain-containing protein [Coprinellus micaceus]
MSDVTSNPSRPPSPSASVLAHNDLPTARPYRFVWDPSTRRPGPESVAGTTEGGRYANDYIGGNAQYPLGVLNNPSSLNLADPSLPAEWSSTKHGFHAISTVLNNPHKKQAPPKAHSSLPAVPPADLPRVRRKDFESYLKAIRPEWEKYERNTQFGKEGQVQPQALRFGTIPEGDDEDEAREDNTLLIPRQRSGSTATAPPSPGPVQARTIPLLDTVPSIFFEPDFNLGDARAFNAVTEQSSLASQATPTQTNMRIGVSFDDDDPTDPLSLSHTLPLLEKFDHYADTVEQHLIREISLRSSSFFAALTNLRDLQTSSTQCLSRIQNLRGKLREVDEGTAKKGLELVRVKRKQTRVREVCDGVKTVEGVVEMMGVLKGLVHAGQWGEALSVVEEVEGMWEPLSAQTSMMEKSGEGRLPNGHARLEFTAEEDENAADSPTIKASSHPKIAIPLSSLAAFSAVPAHLRSISMEIAASLSADLVSVLKEDWISFVEAKDAAVHDGVTPTGETVQTPVGDSSPLCINGTVSNTAENVGRDPSRDEGLKDRLKPLLMNLVRTKGLKEGILSWKELILNEVKRLISKPLPELDAEPENTDGQPGEVRAGLANHLRNLSQDEFMSLVKDIYRTLMSGVERIKAQGEVISELLDSLKPEIEKHTRSQSTHRPPAMSTSSSSRSSASSHESLPSISEDLTDLLFVTCELANVTAAKVVSYRSEQHSQLDLPQFIDFFNTSWSFVMRCEVLSRKMIVGLRSTVLGHAKAWLQAFHQARLTKSAKLVEDEVWNPVAVPPEVQHIANILVDSVMKDSPELVVKYSQPKQVNGSTTQANAQIEGQPPPTAGPATPSKAPGGSSKHLKIDDRPYFTVSATLEVLRLLLDYLKVVVNLSMLTTETMSRVIEFLKAFNSRTCQVVLGAGAMRSAGLRNITAKHLALASQSLSVIFELIPYIRETFRRHLSAQQAVMLVEFDRLKRDYQEHQNEIHAKLIAIMGDRLTIHITGFKAVDWTAAPNPEAPVNNYMIKLVEETTMLHKVLSRYLPSSIVEFVMSEVLAEINHRLSREFGDFELPDQQAKNRLHEDAKYLNKQFSGLRNVRAPTAMLETVVAEKLLPGSRPPPAPSPMVPQTPMRSNTLRANERLRGLLSGRASSFIERALPNPNPGQPTPSIPQPDSQRSPQPPALSPGPDSSGVNGSSNGLITLGSSSSIAASSVSLAASTLAAEPASVSPHLDVPSKQSDPGVPEGVLNGDASEADTAPPPPPKSDAGAN